MTKDILLTISGLQFQAQEDGDGEPVEVITPGDYYKKNEKHYVLYDEVMEGMSTSDSFTDDERQLYDELMQLPDIQRVPVYLHFYEGYTYKEIAKILQISESAVAMRISRGKDELKKRLEE